MVHGFLHDPVEADAISIPGEAEAENPVRPQPFSAVQQELPVIRDPVQRGIGENHIESRIERRIQSAAAQVANVEDQEPQVPALQRSGGTDQRLQSLGHGHSGRDRDFVAGSG